jgi:ribosomal protein S18 acetylase RimI-like enzyme
MDRPAGLCTQATGADDYALAVGLLRGSSMAEIAAHAQRLRASPVPYRGCVWRQGAQSEVVACAQVARDGELAGLYDVCTAPAARGRGLATALCASVLREAHEAGARIGYLQVDADNAAALTVYRRLGFVDAYGYHYRLAPEVEASAH